MSKLVGKIEDSNLQINVKMLASGPKGEKGEKGEKGDKGEQGIPGLDGKSLEFHWNGTQLGIRIEGETTYQYVNLKGDKGEQGERGIQGLAGKNLEFNWNGTQLGVRQEGQSSYQYVNLKGDKGDTGEKGDKGDKGEPGDIANLTSQHVTTALGYSPISPTQLNSKVQTDVPSGAKFTDTITTINGKTGAISKADIVALGIPSQDTTYSEITTAEIDTGTASTLRTITARRLKYLLDKIVALFPSKTSELTNDSGFLTSVSKSDVGLGNVDNVKQASKTEFDEHDNDDTRHITSVERTKWNAVDNKVDKVTGKGLSTNDYTTAEKNKLAGIEAGAQVNTVTSVAGKTGAVAVSKSDVGLGNVDNVKQASKTEFDEHDNDDTRHITSVERTKWNAVDNKVDKVTGKGLSTNDYTTAEKNKLAGIEAGAQVNTVTSVAGKTGAVAVSKSDVGLSNVDNVKQMPISGGVLENYREKLVTLSGTSTAINLSLGNVFTHSLTGNTTYSITNAVSGQAHSFTLLITQTATVRTLTFPASVKWQDGEIPDMSTANKTYVLTFVTINGGTTWLGMFGGEF